MVNPAELENDGIFIDNKCKQILYLEKGIVLPSYLRL